MNVGIIGLGYWGPNIVRNLVSNKDIKKIVCADLDAVRLDKVKQSFPSVHITKDYREIMKDPGIDAVAIVTPVDTHYSLAKEALENGKHILVEKPFTSTVRQAEELNQLAEKRGLVVMVDHTFIYTPAVKKIKELYANGEIGELYYYDSVRVNLGLFQRDINVIWDLAPHDFSIMHYIIDKKPRCLKAMGADHVGKGLEDVAYVYIDFGDNLIAHFHINWLSPVKIRKVLIAGTKKMIVYDDMENYEKVKVYDKGIDVKSKEDEYRVLINYRSGNVYSPVLDNAEALRSLIQEFIDAIHEKRKPLTSGNDGLQVVRMLEATQKSIKNNGEIVYL